MPPLQWAALNISFRATQEGAAETMADFALLDTLGIQNFKEDIKACQLVPWHVSKHVF